MSYEMLCIVMIALAASYEMLRIVMIGFAKLKVEMAIII